jgi:hypothetical protein
LDQTIHPHPVSHDTDKRWGLIIRPHNHGRRWTSPRRSPGSGISMLYITVSIPGSGIWMGVCSGLNNQIRLTPSSPCISNTEIAADLEGLIEGCWPHRWEQHVGLGWCTRGFAPAAGAPPADAVGTLGRSISLRLRPGAAYSFPELGFSAGSERQLSNHKNEPATEILI